MKVPYFVPWITPKDKVTVVKSLNQRWLTNGIFVKKFEDKIKKFVGSNYSTAVGSATHALHLSVRSLGIGKEDEIIVPTFTFVATANAVSYCNAKPVLCDVDTDTFNILPNEIEKKITKRTKAIIVVHYGGQACDMEEIFQIAKKNGLYVIEDCAHALGSTYGLKKCGNMGITGCFSFYPTKVITTGEGGMITTNNAQIYKKLLLLRSQGMDVSAKERESIAKWSYDIVDLGYNYRLDEIRASLGLSQASRINEINKRRIKIAKKYDEKIKKIKGLLIPQTRPDRNHIYHLYTIKVEKEYPLTRDELFKKMYDLKIGTSVQYSPLHLMSYNKKEYHNKRNEFPNSNILKDQVLCLPIFPMMSDKQIEFVISALS